jgi:hypothetical protein
MRQTQLPAVSLIFQKGKNGNYTKGALLYQDIISYCIDRLEDGTLLNPFTHRELAKWLLNNNEQLINHYKDPSTKYYTISYRIENTQDTIKNKLNDLIDLGIISIVGSTKVQKGNATTPLYQYKGLGYLLAWIIESFDSDKRERANNEIYQLVDFTFKVKSKSSYDIFQGVFGSFVVDVLREKMESYSKVRDIHELFHRIGVLYIDDPDQSDFFVSLWHETLNELDARTKELVLHRIKLEIERRMEENAEDISTFEQVRFQVKDRHDVVALEGYCNKCDTHYSTLMDLEYYLRVANFVPSIPSKIDCDLCKEKFCYAINLLEY